MKPENKKISRRPMRFVSSSRPAASSSRTSPMAPAGGSDSPPELIYGLHAVREALRAGSRPLQRLLLLRTDRQFADLAQLAKAQRVPVHIEPPPAFDRLVPGGNHQGVIALIAAKSYDTTEQILDRAKTRGEKPIPRASRRSRRSTQLRRGIADGRSGWCSWGVHPGTSRSRSDNGGGESISWSARSHLRRARGQSDSSDSGSQRGWPVGLRR